MSQDKSKSSAAIASAVLIVVALAIVLLFQLGGEAKDAYKPFRVILGETPTPTRPIEDIPSDLPPTSPLSREEGRMAKLTASYYVLLLHSKAGEDLFEDLRQICTPQAFRLAKRSMLLREDSLKHGKVLIENAELGQLEIDRQHVFVDAAQKTIAPRIRGLPASRTRAYWTQIDTRVVLIRWPNSPFGWLVDAEPLGSRP